jgi:hypothetical protein
MINPILSKGDSVDHCQDGEDGFLQYVTLRDYFAGCALTNLVLLADKYSWEDQDISEMAYDKADAMLSERANQR